MDRQELASFFCGTARAESAQTLEDGETLTYTARAVSDSEDGTVILEPFGELVSPDDDAYMEVETSVAVSEGDEVLVTLYGGDGKRMYASGVIGSGDAQRDALRQLEHKTQTIEFDEDVGLILGEVDGAASATLSSRSLDFDYDGETKASVGLDGFNADVIVMGSVAWLWDEGQGALMLKAVM